MRRSIFLMAILVVLAWGAQALAADVLVLNSALTKDWYISLGWDFDAEMDNILLTLDILGVDYEEISDAQLKADLGDSKLLILPNNRKMAEEAVLVVKDFIKGGGKVFGLYQSSFRNENNEVVNEENHFQLDEIYKVAYVSWTGSPPLHGYIRGDAEHPIWEGLPEFVRTARNTAMVVRTLPEGKVLGAWFNDDKEWESQMDHLNGAIIEGQNAIYVGESLFDPDVYEEADVRQLIENIITYLLD